ncbi:MAG: UDP-N-acetylmuramate:L-alanyl-gamma-D-glutamyl-meso-diaminopimelate ligase [Acidobacteriota bacterium]|nr:UDP-N-acetylmuramate:L-alanyl-gamma-D-glutamyl-meso-diaminopimelate ligase [Acidobacteriota bacterium]
MSESPRHIHLSGICGTAMASLAGLLQLQGHRITGSDKAAYPPMSDLLRGLGIPVLEPYVEANLEPAPDLVVIGNALSRGNPEVERVLDERIPFTSMAALLHDEFLKGRESLVVAGTHGKTTTTSMLAWIYQVAARENPALEPSFLIGGVAENFGSSFQLRPTRTFILEGDEYDTAFFDKGPKFLHYFPDALILTHVEFDHADIYADLEAVKTAFKRLVNLVPRRGLIVAYDNSSDVSDCVARALCRVERYGFGEAADWRIGNLRLEGGVTRWEVWRQGALWAELEMKLAGEHNALNATAAAALAFGQGVSKEAIRESFATFRNVKRRLEVRAEIGGITVIEDFAHHPTAIRETLRALRSVYPQSRLWAVVEPRSNTLRRKVLAGDLVESLSLADRVALAAVYQMERIPENERLHPEDVVRALNVEGTEAALFADADAIVEGIAPRLEPGDVVAILSNGGFGGIYEKLPARLRERFRASLSAMDEAWDQSGEVSHRFSSAADEKDGARSRGGKR